MKRIRKIEGMQGTRIKKRKLRVAAYCRVSTDSDAQLESLEASPSADFPETQRTAWNWCESCKL